MNRMLFTDYFKYRAKLRNYDLDIVTEIMKYSTEKYYDTQTNRKIVIGNHNSKLVLIPYEIDKSTMIPITIHATTRQQINFRLKTGRFKYE